MTIRIKKVDLKRIIREEVEYMLSEINPYHMGRSKTSGGRFTSKEKAASSKGSYSLTQNAKDEVGKDGIHQIGRGKVTAKGKLSPVYGMASGDDKHQCGRLNQAGNKKPKTRRCGDYKKGNFYWIDESESDESEEDNKDMKQKKKETEKRNRNKNKNDLIPRQEDSPSVRKGKIFPGAKELSSLANGIYEEEEDQEEDINSPADDIYIRQMIAQELSKLRKNASPKQRKIMNHCSWNQVMNALRDVEIATHPPKPK